MQDILIIEGYQIVKKEQLNKEKIIMTAKIETQYKGSEMTFNMVQEQIKERFGIEQAEIYDPELNCFTARYWVLGK